MTFAYNKRDNLICQGGFLNVQNPHDFLILDKIKGAIILLTLLIIKFVRSFSLTVMGQAGLSMPRLNPQRKLKPLCQLHRRSHLEINF